jgi:hypothetical protein
MRGPWGDWPGRGWAPPDGGGALRFRAMTSRGDFGARAFGRVSLLAAVGAALLLGGLFLLGGALALLVPHAIEVGEPFVVSAAWRLGMGASLYAPIGDLPFLHNNYHPLVQALAAPLLVWTGPSFVPMRAMSLAAALGLLGLGARLVARAGGGRGAAALAALLPLSSGFVFPWFVVGRVDVVATLLGAATVWASVRWPERRAPWLLLAVLAFAAKQTAVAGALAVLMHRARTGHARQAATLGLVFIAACAAFVGGLAALTGGQSFLHTIAYNAAHERSALWPPELPPHRILWALGPTTLLACATLVVPAWRRLGGGPWREWAILALAVGAFSVRKSGSHVHHFLEATVALGVLAGAAWRPATASWSRRGKAIGLLFLALSVLPHAHEVLWKRSRFFLDLATRADPVPEEIRAALRATDRPLLLLAKLGSLAVEAGRPAHLDIADFIRLQELGRFDPAARLLPLIRARAFGAIGVPEFAPDDPAARHFDPRRLHGFVEALEASYRPLRGRIHDPRWLHRGVIWLPLE